MIQFNITFDKLYTILVLSMPLNSLFKTLYHNFCVNIFQSNPQAQQKEKLELTIIKEYIIRQLVTYKQKNLQA